MTSPIVEFFATWQIHHIGTEGSISRPCKATIWVQNANLSIFALSSHVGIFYGSGSQPVVHGPPVVHGHIPGGPRPTDGPK